MESVSVDNTRSWIICGACVFINMMTYGTSKLTGIFFVESMPRYNVGRNAASFPYTFGNFIKCLSGPLIGYLSPKIGVRRVIVIGCVFSSVGLGACYFAEDILFLIVFYGVIFGIGIGSNTLVPVVINQHFYRYRGVANGLCISGIQLGIFLLTPVSEALLSSYGLSGTFLILSGLMLNCLPAAILVIMLKSDYISKSNGVSQNFPTSERDPLISGYNPNRLYSTEISKHNIVTKLHTEKLPPSLLSMDESTTLKNQIYFPTGQTRTKYATSRYNTIGDCKSEPYLFKTNSESIIVANAKDNPTRCKCKPNKDSKNSSSFNPDEGQYKQGFQAGTNKVHSSFTIIFDPIFIIISITKSFYLFSTVCLSTVTVDFSNDIGVPESLQKYTLMASPLGGLLGQLFIGWIVDKSYISKTNVVVVSCVSQAFLYSSLAFSNGSVMFMSLLCIYGVAHCSEILISPLLVADYIAEDKQEMAMASSYFLAAPLSLAISPLIGFLRDYVGTYEYLFYGLSGLSIISALLTLLIPCLDRRKRKTAQLQ